MTNVARDTSEGRNSVPPEPAVPAELLDVRNIAALLGGCSTRHVYRLSDAGFMPRPVRLGNLVRWRRAEVLAWIADGCPRLEHSKAARQ